MAPRCWERAPSTTSNSAIRRCWLDVRFTRKRSSSGHPYTVLHCNPVIAAIRLTGYGTLDRGYPASVQLDVSGPDYLAPFLGFVGDELAEVGGRARKRRAAQVGKLRLDFQIGQRGVDLPIE